MEVADLNWDIFKNRCETTPAVHYGGIKHPTSFFQYLTTIYVVSHLFTWHFIPPNVSFEIPRSEDTNTITPAPKGCVGNNDCCLGHQICRHTDFAIIKSVSNPLWYMPIFFSQFRKCLLAVSIFAPQF